MIPLNAKYSFIPQKLTFFSKTPVIFSGIEQIKFAFAILLMISNEI